MLGYVLRKNFQFQNKIFYLKNTKNDRFYDSCTYILRLGNHSRSISYDTQFAMEITGNIKNYEWGKLGNDSLVAQLACLNSNTFEISSSTPYAELWMGDHTSGPSTIKSNGKELSTVLGNPLPFLFKVLSIRKALSIQVHPNKAEAERLFKERPDIYKDPNHKPELAIALTPFQALCGFRPYAEIHKFLEDLPPLKELIGGEENSNELKGNSTADLRKVYEKLLASKEHDLKRCIDCIATKYTEVLASSCLLDVFNTINADFPNDVGVLSLFFLNLIQLKPGEAIFLGANEIHAYISGNCIECMACSDNVIRAGLTPKYKDVAQLISCLNYTGLPAKEKLFKPITKDKYTEIFAPPVKDFAVVALNLPVSEQSYELKVHKDNSILLVLQGERSLTVRGHSTVILKRGSIVYIPPDVVPILDIATDSSNKDDFIAYVAMRNHFQS